MRIGEAEWRIEPFIVCRSVARFAQIPF